MLHEKKTFIGTIIATIGVAICCFTPLLVIGFSALGISALSGYLDYVLIPLLILCLFLSVKAFRGYNKACKECNIQEKSEE